MYKLEQMGQMEGLPMYWPLLLLILNNFLLEYVLVMLYKCILLYCIGNKLAAICIYFVHKEQKEAF